LKQATDELLRLRKEVTVYKQHEEELAVQWKQGETSNNHALRMVGTLQTESDRLRQESETSKRQLEEVKAAMVLKTEESERWMSERTILGNRQNDLRQEIRKLSIQLAAKTEECSKTKVDLLQLEGKVELCLYYTCWWSSLCNFQYRSLYENTCSYNFDC
jgi:chromosome segregation ATPase